MIALRLYQNAAIDRVRAQLRKTRRVLLVLPTGGGKTIIASAIISSAFSRGRRVIFFAHRRELVNQTKGKLIASDIPRESIGIMMADDPETRPDAPIQIASIDTFRHRDPPPADLIIIDEAHRSLAQSYLDVIERYSSDGAVVLGLTATPFRADGGGLGDVYEALEVVAMPRQLIAEGFLVDPRVFSAPADVRPDLSNVKVRCGDYVESDLADAMNQRRLVGGIVAHWQKLAAGMRTVAFAVNIAHSKHIAEQFTAAGIPAEHLDGETPTRERDAILARLERGETLVVSNCGVLCEGWDQPAVKVAILARPTKSTGLYLQQAGRILRPFEGTRAIILDHAGNALAHGLPQDGRDFDLEPTKKRRGAGPTKACPECDAVIPAGTCACPECGHTFERAAPEDIEESGGELVELTGERQMEYRRTWKALVQDWHAANALRVKRGQRAMKPGVIWHRFRERFGVKPPPGCKLPREIATDEEKAVAFAELRIEARERGYRPGWAVYRFRERFGHDPRSRVA